MNRPTGTILAMSASLDALDGQVSRLRAAAVTAALAAEDDPTMRERVQRALERVKKVEEELALLKGNDVPDVEMATVDDVPEVEMAPPAGAPITAAEFSTSQREKLADEGEAMPDGSFPIRNTADLHNAVRGIGRAKDPAAARAHIKRRARELHAANVIPDTWD
mgnify:CR=1 FL=1